MIGGLPVTVAAIDVGIQVGQSTDAEVDVIRTSYYDRGVDKAAWNVFWGSFLGWREWVLTSPQARLDFFLNQYESEQGRMRRRSLEKLFEDLRSDEVQAARNRSWALERYQSAQARIESNQWDPDSDWKSLATDHSEVGRFRAAFGQVEEALSHLIQAVEIWRTGGQAMPRIQARAVPQLEAAIAYLQSLGRRPGEQPLRSSAFSDPFQNSLRDAWRTGRPETALRPLTALRTRVVPALANPEERQKFLSSWVAEQFSGSFLRCTPQGNFEHKNRITRNLVGVSGKTCHWRKAD